MKVFQWFQSPPLNGPRSIVLLRLMAGGVFLWEGVLKFIYTNQGVGRFLKLGFPFPELTATFVGLLEITGGLLILAGALTRWIAVPFVLEMCTAMLTTKVALYFGTSPLALPATPPQVGIWAVLHEIRSEFAQLLTVAFLALNGPGEWSWDSLVKRKERNLL